MALRAPLSAERVTEVGSGCTANKSVRSTWTQSLRNALGIGLLFIACIVGLQVSFLVAEAGGALAGMESSASSVLSSTSEALGLARSTLSLQQGYYRDSASHIKALTKAAAIDAVQLGRLIEKVDGRVDGVADAAEKSLGSIRDGATTIAGESTHLGDEARPLLQAATDATQKAGDAAGDLSRIAGDPDLKRSVAALESSSENLNKTTAEAAEAMGYIRDMLSPTKKSFWKRLLYLMIPRPTVGLP